MSELAQMDGRADTVIYGGGSEFSVLTVTYTV